MIAWLQRSLRLFSIFTAIAIMPLVGALLGAIVTSAFDLPRDGAASLPDLVFLAMGVSMGLLATTYRSGQCLCELYDCSTRQAFVEHALQLMGFQRSTQVIENGKTIVPAGSKTTLAGPRHVVLRESAAMFCKGGCQTDIRGPGSYLTTRWEHVGNTYDLRPKQELFTFDQVLTENHMPTRVELWVTYGVCICNEAIHDGKKLTEADKLLLTRFDVEAPDVRLTVRYTLEQELRRCAAGIGSEEMLSTTGPRKVANRILALGNRELNSRGVRVYTVAVNRITPATQVSDAVTQAAIDLTLDQARTDAWQAAFGKAVTALKAAKANNLELNELQVEVLRRFLEGLTRDARFLDKSVTTDTVKALLGQIKP